MRNMSFSMTTQQIKDKTKSVTRRYGWAFLRPGDVVMACEKVRGLRKGEQIHKLCPIRIVSNTAEPLAAIRDYPNDCTLEGFPDLTPDQFIDMLVRKYGKSESEPLQRIEFEYVEEGC